MYTSNIQALTAKLRQTSDEQSNYFSVYQAENEIELRPGCQNYKKSRFIGSYRCYENAYEAAEEMAAFKQMPLKNYVF